MSAASPEVALLLACGDTRECGAAAPRCDHAAFTAVFLRPAVNHHGHRHRLPSRRVSGTAGERNVEGQRDERTGWDGTGWDGMGRGGGSLVRPRRDDTVFGA